MTPYEQIGIGYAHTRRDDPRVAAAIHAALGDARSLVNVGAGTGSYEPADRFVLAVEPSLRMIEQRPAGAAPVVRAVAEALPLRDGAVDAALAVLTLHHWTDQPRACRELLRVTRQRVVLLTYDPAHDEFWLTEDYFPQFQAEDRLRFPSLEAQAELLGGDVEITPLPIPADCVDGFLGAFWKRPQAYLDPAIRRGISSFAASDPDSLADGLQRLEADLASGRWQATHGARFQAHAAFDLGYRLVVARRG